MMPSPSWSGPPPPLPPPLPYYIERSQDQREHRPQYGPPSGHLAEHRHSLDYQRRDERDYRKDGEYPGWQERDDAVRHEKHRGASPPPRHEPSYYVYPDPNARGPGGGPSGSAGGQSRHGYRNSYSPRERREER
jgi:hypothetical protein